MKCAVIMYHKNIESIYKKEWIEKCVDSIKNQTYKEFDVFELNYGFETNFYYKGAVQYQFKFANHIEAMNYLITHAFNLGYDVVFNTNMDDYYTPDRFEKQLNSIAQGYQLVSSNFNYVHDNQVFKKMDMLKHGDIEFNLMKNHNVIAHPVIAIHKSFWTEELRYNNLLGFEDLDLWKRAIKAGKKFIILPDYLLNYRIHGNQVTKFYKGL